MFEVRFNVAAFERKAREMAAARDQLPFALSLALNEAARETRTDLVQTTWPGHVRERNPNFIRRALRTRFATKRSLRVEIYDDLGRASLEKHADGGEKQPRGSNFAIPAPGVARGAHGVPKGSRPAAVIAKTPKRALRITPRGIFVGQGGQLKLKFALKPSTRQPKDVPFREDFRRSMTSRMVRAFPAAIARAMRTRR